jgi:hypothetical protein
MNFGTSTAHGFQDFAKILVLMFLPLRQVEAGWGSILDDLVPPPTTFKPGPVDVPLPPSRPPDIPTPDMLDVYDVVEDDDLNTGEKIGVVLLLLFIGGCIHLLCFRRPKSAPERASGQDDTQASCDTGAQANDTGAQGAA